jgi:hypothetical protein
MNLLILRNKKSILYTPGIRLQFPFPQSTLALTYVHKSIFTIVTFFLE